MVDLFSNNFFILLSSNDFNLDDFKNSTLESKVFEKALNSNLLQNSFDFKVSFDSSFDYFKNTQDELISYSKKQNRNVKLKACGIIPNFDPDDYFFIHSDLNLKGGNVSTFYNSSKVNLFFIRLKFLSSQIEKNSFSLNFMEY